MLSAISLSFSSRSRSAFASAAGMASSDSGFSACIGTPPFIPTEHPQQAGDRVVEPVDYALLQRDDGIVGDLDVPGADDRAALGDVAEPDSEGLLQLSHPVLDVQ